MSSLNYIAVLGRQPELGLVELESLLGPAEVQPFGRQAALVDREPDMSRLGASVKLGRVIGRLPADDPEGLVFSPGVFDELMEMGAREGKLVFGISVYGGKRRQSEVNSAGIQLKPHFAIRAGSVRYVRPDARSTVLTAAQLKFNRVIERGFELLVVYAGNEAVLAVTTAVQDIDWYSKRDYDRPARSAKVGMLPPKLAQVLVNSVQAQLICDPFCGTGVILQEALLMGRKVVGSDIAPEMVAATHMNMKWLARQVNGDLIGWHVQAADARTVKLPAGCAVVSEGYLGPNLSAAPGAGQLGAIRVELLALYKESLTNWGKQLPAGAEVSLCVPAWRNGKGWQYLGLVDELPRLGYTPRSFEHVRTPLLYARDDQTVGRQLLLLRKN